MGTFSPTEATQNLGKYTLIEKLGEGYLGPVYRGFDQDLGGPVVVRILCEGIKWDARLEETFNRECRAVSDLQHPNIIKILEVGREGQTRYIAMESLGSGTLENMIARNSAVPVEAKLSIMIQVADGLGYAHKKGILHRDLGPGKIHMTPDGSVKIRDFSIAHVLMKYLPHPAVRWGAPIYLCPEQIQQKDCDERSDIFSAGTIFYELLNHFHPFHDRDSNKALDNILSDAEIPTFEKFPEAPPGIWTILRSCLAKDPGERYRGTDELSSACKELLKSLAEDKQVMLAELYAALSPLKIAAAQPNASEKTLTLLQEIQKLLRGAREPDYGHLDHLMTVLLEQYPVIQAFADNLPEIGNDGPQLPDEPEIMVGAQTGFSPLEEMIEPEELPQAKTSAEPLPEPAAVDTAAAPEIQTPPLQGGDTGVSNWDAHNLAAAPVPAKIPEVVSLQLPEPPAENPVEAAVRATPEQTGNPAKPLQSAETDGEESIPAFAQKSVRVETAGCSAPEISGAADPEKPASADPLPPAPANPAGAHTGSMYFRASSHNASLYRRISKPSYRSAVVLLSILVMATAGYIALGTDTAASINRAFTAFMPKTSRILHSLVPRAHAKSTENSDQAEPQGSRDKREQDTSETILKEARAAAAAGRIDESKGLIQRILEKDPSNQAAIAALKEVESASAAGNRSSAIDRNLEQSVSRISGLINSGKFQIAKMEIDHLQQAYPNSPEIAGLRKRWDALNSKQALEQTRKEEEQQRVKEDEWNRQISDSLGRGKYNEASGALTLWLSENPGNPRAVELNAKIQEIQRQLKAYAQAMTESRYSDAYNALSSAERLNPADPNIAELRRQTDSRKAAARAVLTVHRLGAKAALLLDGKPVGKDGEVENESIPIGSHTLAVENSGGAVASKVQEYAEGQHVAWVYDLLKQTLRPMVESDRESLTRRKAMEEVSQFPLEHDHGVFRGSCRGVLSLDTLDVAYSPSAGSHGFRIPFKLLKLKAEGKSVSMYYISDNTHFQTFKFQDPQAAGKFVQKWDELKALIK